MADTVSTITLLKDKSKVVYKFLNKSDASGESNVKKIDLSTLTNYNGVAPKSVFIEKILYDVQGMKVQLIADGTTPIVLATLGGFQTLDYQTCGGGLSSTNTGTNKGNINITTIGAASNSTYDITVFCRLVG